MPEATLTVWGHAGVRLERAGQVLVLDPGAYTDVAVLNGAQAVLITHEHADHVVPEQLAEAVGADPGLQVWAPSSIGEQLTAAGAPAERIHGVESGDSFTAAGFDVQVLGGRHAVIHPDLPPAANVAYLIDGGLLHPGDAFTPVPEGSVHTLLLPVAGPWMKLAEAVDYLRQVAPQLVVPIHDAVLSDVGKSMIDRMIGGLAGDVEYRRSPAGEGLQLQR